MRHVQLLSVILLATHTTLIADDAPHKLSIKTDRESAIYQLGEQAKFVVTVKQGDNEVATGQVEYFVDDFVARTASEEFPRGEVAVGEAIVVRSSKPRFLRCTATYTTSDGKTLQGFAGAAFAPTKIGLSLPVPDDFDKFWAVQKAELAKLPMEPKLTPIESPDRNLDCFDVQVRCTGGAPVSGYLAKPKSAAEKSLPAILWVHGAGVRGSSISNAVNGAREGMLSMDINAHGIANGKPGFFYRDLSNGRLKNYRFAGRKSRGKSYFRGMFLRLVRAIDFLTAQPEWDGKTVVVIGHSQGGGQALAAGGLDQRVTFVASGVPAICDHSGRVVDRINGWPKLVPQGANGKPQPRELKAARYVDAVNFASRCKADAIMSVGFIDRVCPPSSCYAAFNQLRGKKQVINKPLMGHAAPADIHRAFFDAVKAHVQQQSGRDKRKDSIELPDDVREKCAKVLRDALRSDEFWPSIHAAEGLTLGGFGGEVREYLTPKLKAISDDQQRCGVVRELVRAGDWRKARIMHDILAGKDSHGHVHAAESSFKVAEVGDGVAFRRAMKSDNVTLQLMSSAALARCGNPEAMRFIRNMLTDSDPDTIRIAAWILARIGDKSDIAQLNKNLKTAMDPMVKCYHEHALASLGDADGLRALARNLDSDDPAIRTYAATFAGDARAYSTSSRLIELLEDENIDVRARAAQSLLVMSRPRVGDDAQRPIPAGWTPTPHEDISEVVYPATEEHPRYTEGSIVRLADGSLLYAVTEFVGGSDFAKARIVSRRSADDGRTWGEKRLLQESTGKLNVMSVTLRRLNAPRDNTIAMFYLQKNAYDDLRVYVRFSQDEAKTFGEPVRVTAESGYHVLNNDRVTQLSTGRLLVPCASTADVRKVNHFVCSCWLSDDGGRTWKRGQGRVDLPKRGAMEPEVVELKDGRVLMIVRTQLGYIAKSISEDGGNTWGEPQRLSDLVAPEAPATLRRIPSTGDLLLIWNNTFQEGAVHGGKRTPLTAAVSSDEGETWKHIRNLETDADRTYSYPSLIFVKGRAILSYWESSPGKYSNRFRSLPVAWFYRAD